MNRRQAPVALAACLCLRGVWANDSANTLLTVSGRIRRFNDAEGRVYRFSEVEFMALPQETIITGTVWTPRSRFDGPLLADVLKHVDAQPGPIHLRALNDYSISIPWSDMERYGIILAHSRNGLRMLPSNYGPLWLMYPRDDHVEALSGPVASTRYIWQVVAVEVR